MLGISEQKQPAELAVSNLFDIKKIFQNANIDNDKFQHLVVLNSINELYFNIKFGDKEIDKELHEIYLTNKNIINGYIALTGSIDAKKLDALTNMFSNSLIYNNTNNPMQQLQK